MDKYMTLWEFEEILKASWTKDTSIDKNWSEDNVSLGQCAVTALVVNDYFGGKIMRCMTSTGSHYYNILNDGCLLVDFTKGQFGDEIPHYETGEERTREYLLSNENTKSRYLKLLKNVKEYLELKKDVETATFNAIQGIISKYKKRLW